ncbi:phage baseplate assembly protein V [Cryptosporangium phraense]|uniref:Type IV secretion protein Rhs n=1 Tax=Cryptosporangium phraense TaxID=2593070 RepID=A0A545APZ6_9ACTN|nr:phage baseplate assembly protein V [Cryptosporangium phraense]TQS43384.1 type IV secretion protein Rhs [Cryptosporangium phraense]
MTAPSTARPAGPAVPAGPAGPGVSVELGGRLLAGPARILAVRVAQRLNQPSQCELTLTEAPPFPLGPGTGLVLRIEGTTTPLFDGETTTAEFEAGPDGAVLVRLRGYDRLHRLRQRQQQRVLPPSTPAALARLLAEPVGLTVDAPADGPSLDGLLQHRQTDLGLLLQVCERTGRYLTVDGSTLRVITLAGHGIPIALELGGNLGQLSVEENLDAPLPGDTALGWNAQRAETHVGTAEPARTQDPGNVRTLVNQLAGTPEEIGAVAAAVHDVRTASVLVATGVADGDPNLRAGARVTVRGAPVTVPGPLTLTEVTHTIDARGYLCAFTTRPPERPDRPEPASVTLGAVTDVQDPDGLVRVRVRLPAFGDLDAGWLPVVCPGAGGGRGIVALPDVGDTVLVVLPGGEPSAGLVLGSLFGSLRPPDPGIRDGRVARWSLTTATGQSVVLDDADGSLRLDTGAGSYLQLGPDRSILHAATDLVLEAPGHGMTIRAGTVDFEHAP